MLLGMGFLCEDKEQKGEWGAFSAAVNVIFFVLHDAYMSVFGLENWSDYKLIISSSSLCVLCSINDLKKDIIIILLEKISSLLQDESILQAIMKYNVYK